MTVRDWTKNEEGTRRRIPWISKCKVANRNNFANFSRCSPRCTSLRLSRSRILSLFLSSSSSFFPPLSHNGIAKNSILPETVKNNASLAFFCLFSDCSLAYEAQREKQGQVGGKIRNGLLESEAENTARERRLLDFSSRE